MDGNKALKSSAVIQDKQESKTASILFTVPHKVGALMQALQKFESNSVNLSHLESRPSRSKQSAYEFFAQLEVTPDDPNLKRLIEELQVEGDVVVISNTPQPSLNAIPWFPRKISDLDSFAAKILEYGEELAADHPGFTDEEYRKRRFEIVQNAKNYRHGQTIPRVQYTDAETKTWSTVYGKLKALYPTHACREHNYILPLLEQNCGYSENNIPQLEDISKFLKDCTGFTLRPVAGLISSRDFLNGLAFRVFHSTQYIRHHSRPLYTPEPDICHELLGHVPLFADPAFADFSQEIGLASLGASDDDIQKLTTCYWFTVEFGLCKQEGVPKAYGAGLLSSFGELEYALSDKPERRPFEPEVTAKQPYPITEYQPVYFVADSFEAAKNSFKRFADTLDRPFALRYNALTQRIEMLDSKRELTSLAQHIQSELSVLTNAIQKLSQL